MSASDPRPPSGAPPRPRRRGGPAAVAQPVRFLAAGGLATAINWAVRFPLSLAVPFDVAVALAYGIGMVAGFVLYRGWVFRGSTVLIHHQLWRFLAVNGAGLGTVVLGSGAALSALGAAAALPPGWRPGAAHALALMLGAVVNYLGHRSLTFARRPPRDPSGAGTGPRLSAGRSAPPDAGGLEGRSFQPRGSPPGAASSDASAMPPRGDEEPQAWRLGGSGGRGVQRRPVRHGAERSSRPSRRAGPGSDPDGRGGRLDASIHRQRSGRNARAVT